MGGLLHDRYDRKFKTRLKNIKFRRLKTWQLFLCFILLLVLVAVFLRIDHLRMNQLIDAVAVADENGDADEITNALNDLRNFTNSHIVINITEQNGNQTIEFGTGPVYLKYQYTRAAEAALAEAEQSLSSDANPNGNIYQQIATSCRNSVYYSGNYGTYSDFINCISTTSQQYPAAAEITDSVIAQIPSTSLYLREYVSPIWAPCFSGWLIIFTLIILIIIIIRVLIWVFLKLAILFL